MTDNYDYIHQASNERLAEMLEGKVRGVDTLIDHVESFNIEGKELKFLYEDKALYEEAAKRLRIPPHRTFHEEYMGEVLERRNKMKPFNLSEWLQDKSRKVVTRDGRPVRIVCWDRNTTYWKIIGLVTSPDGSTENPFTYDVNGNESDGCLHDHKNDLFFADEEEELTEFEKKLVDLVSGWCDSHIETPEEYINKHSQTLLDLARKELNLVDNTCGEYALNEAYKQGKQDALKDLPKWKKMPNGIQGNGDFNPTYLVRASNGYCFTTPGLSWDKDSMYIELSELEKLPKEE